MAWAPGAPAAAEITSERQCCIAGLRLLCALELLAHSAMLPTDMIVVQARVPKSLSVQTVGRIRFASELEQPGTFQENARLRNGLGKEQSYSGAVCAFGYYSE